MLPKHKRISRDSFKLILIQGQLFHSPHFLLRTINSPKEGYATLVSKKIARGAVDRNRIRRRIYAVLRSLVVQIKKPTNIIISAKPGALKISFLEQEKEITQLLRTARII